MDQLLLSSPQLHPLQMNICFDPVDVCPLISGRSELQILKNCLIQGNSIKTLRLALEDVERNLYWSTPEQLVGLDY